MKGDDIQLMSEVFRVRFHSADWLESSGPAGVPRAVEFITHSKLKTLRALITGTLRTCCVPFRSTQAAFPSQKPVNASCSRALIPPVQRLADEL